MRTLMVYSGGLDSTVLLYKLMGMGHEVSAVNFQYGSRHNVKEGHAAGEICRLNGIRLVVIDLPFIGSMFRSSLLLDGEAIPEGHYQAENMRSTVVPFRNGIMLSIATGLAESLKMDSIAIAAHSGDHYIYPDCRPEFLDCMEASMYTGTDTHVKLYRPFFEMTKGDIVTVGSTLGVPFGLTWTCYKGTDLHCGKCGACMERKEAFIMSEVIDPTKYSDDVVSSIN